MLCVHQVTISLLDKAMLDSGKDRFLIDGFPRNEENRSAFEKQVQLPLLPQLAMHPYAAMCPSLHRLSS